MSLTVCTGWNLAGWHQYGRRFLESFEVNWPEDVRLEICGEGDAMEATSAAASALEPRREITFRVLRGIPGCEEFIAEHGRDPVKCGRARRRDHNWKERAVAAGYNWRYDAVKFCRQGFIPHHVAACIGPEHRPSDFLCWLDGDVVTHAKIEHESVVTGLLPQGKAIAFLGREPKHPDIAFQLYDLRMHQATDFLREFRHCYLSGEVFRLPEWHSAFVWRHVLRSSATAITRHGDRFVEWAHNLTPGGSGHVWHQSPLAQWGDHLKGDRKERGRSPERRR
jgi:hypothetical protein